MPFNNTSQKVNQISMRLGTGSFNCKRTKDKKIKLLVMKGYRVDMTTRISNLYNVIIPPIHENVGYDRPNTRSSLQT